jgi:hypothetical protein
VPKGRSRPRDARAQGTLVLMPVAVAEEAPHLQNPTSTATCAQFSSPLKSIEKYTAHALFHYVLLSQTRLVQSCITHALVPTRAALLMH